MYLFGGNSPLRTVFITDARPPYFLYVTCARASDKIASEKKAFLSDSILTSGIGNKKEAVYSASFEIISNRNAFIASSVIHDEKLPKILRKYE